MDGCVVQRPLFHENPQQTDKKVRMAVLWTNMPRLRQELPLIILPVRSPIRAQTCFFQFQPGNDGTKQPKQPPSSLKASARGCASVNRCLLIADLRRDRQTASRSLRIKGSIPNAHLLRRFFSRLAEAEGVCRYEMLDSHHPPC